MNKEELKKKIIEANDFYRKGETKISDLEYDSLVETFQKEYPNEYEDFRNSLNEGKIEFGTKIKHAFIMGSLDKIKNSDNEALNKFIHSYVHNKLNISAKVDGISSVARYVNGKLISFASRGDGYIGMDYTDKAPFIKGLKQNIDTNDHEIFIRGELVILNSEIIDSDTNYRNICAGYMNSKYWNKEDIKKISFIPYTILGDKYTKIQQFKLLENFGFNVAWHESIDTKIDDLSKILTEKAKLEHDYQCDGLVLIDDESHNEIDKYRPKNSMAFKINELNGITKVIDIDWSSVSKDGYICPVYVLEPIEIGGAIISRASAANLDMIEKLGVKYGSIVKIDKANDIIPQVTEVIDNSNSTDIEFPTECPCCGGKLIIDGINLRCLNKNCKDQVIQQITLFIKKLGVKNASNATLENFNIFSFKDLIDFKPNEKYKSEVKFFNELQDKVFIKSKQELLAATNFIGLSEILINKIVDFYGFDNISSGNYIGLPDGIGEITLQKFKDNINENLRIVDMFINDKRYSYVKKETIKKQIIGSVCFTGKLETVTRSQASKMAEEFGFEVKNSVSKGLTYLVTNDCNTMSSKGKNARKLGIKIISEEEFLKLCTNIEEDIMSL